MRCKGKENTDKADCFGTSFGNIDINKKQWTVVLWDGEDDPDLYKTDCLLFEYKEWR